MPSTDKRFLPISRLDMKERGWEELDVILVTCDAYVDHPSYGVAVIGRVLEKAGLQVGVIAEPDCRKADDFLKLGRPRLFFGVTAGNIDSMLANYTANRRIRSSDSYSSGGGRRFRPDRASIILTNRIREAFPGVTVVLGGIEASMRRLAHYDYWQEKVRRSILLDSKADIIVYGMGERQILEIASRLKEGSAKAGLSGIRGTVIAANFTDGIGDFLEIPSFEDVSGDKKKFNEAFKIIYGESDPHSGRALVQRHGDRAVIQYPPAIPLNTDEMDEIYNLRYARSWHPSYEKKGGVPAFETVRFSITSNRGCPGGCNFCSIYLHQGRIVQSRGAKSILSEIRTIAGDRKFKGTITDIGGPTANLYGASCGQWDTKGACRDLMCLMSAKCGKLKLGYDRILNLWQEAAKIPGVKHIFVSSGVRYDLLIDRYSDNYLKELCKDHISGRLKVAPEHTDPEVLHLMNKPPFSVYKRFIQRFNEINRRLGKRQFLVNYFISAHPGSTLKNTKDMSVTLSKLHIHPEQIQDFIPLPMTISCCMYYTGIEPYSGRKVYNAKGLRERRLQRALIQYFQPGNRRYVKEAFSKLKYEEEKPASDIIE